MPKLESLKKAQTSRSLKEEGAWVEIYIAGETEPLRVLMRALSSDIVQKWNNRRLRKLRGAMVDGDLPPEVSRKLAADRFAEVMILDWNLRDNDGTPFPCTPDNIRTVMLECPDVSDAALTEAYKDENYRAKEFDAVAKNSGQPSSLPSDTAAEETSLQPL